MANKQRKPEATKDWLHANAEFFWQNGYLVLDDVLDKNQIAELRDDLLLLFEDEKSKRKKERNIHIYRRLFEHSAANLDLFFNEPIVTLAEYIINEGQEPDKQVPFERTAQQAHVIHNNGLVTPPRQGGVNVWHQDDSPHYIVKEGNAPTNVHLPVLAFTCNYYLSDCIRDENGPTRVIPGSHLFGRSCPGNPETNHDVVYCTGKAGSVVLFNNQVWHAGCANKSDQVRLVSQITYGRRLVGHKFYPFMNYKMPEHVVDYVTKLGKRERRLAGFLDHGAWG